MHKHLHTRSTRLLCDTPRTCSNQSRRRFVRLETNADGAVEDTRDAAWPASVHTRTVYVDTHNCVPRQSIIHQRGAMDDSVSTPDSIGDRWLVQRASNEQIDSCRLQFFKTWSATREIEPCKADDINRIEILDSPETSMP